MADRHEKNVQLVDKHDIIMQRFDLHEEKLLAYAKEWCKSYGLQYRKENA